jgi:hypothetical protein
MFNHQLNVPLHYHTQKIIVKLYDVKVWKPIRFVIPDGCKQAYKAGKSFLNLEYGL